MSPWDPEPSSSERWMARHRTQVTVGAILVIVLGICGIGYLLITGPGSAGHSTGRYR